MIRGGGDEHVPEYVLGDVKKIVANGNGNANAHGPNATTVDLLLEFQHYLACDAFIVWDRRSMLSRSALNEKYTLHPPASRAVIGREEIEYGGSLPREYAELLQISDGMYTNGNLSILGAEGVMQRNADYEVQTYLPGYFMIGDDGGGNAILLNLRDRRIYEVGMGVMAEESMELSADSLEELLAHGTCLAERRGGGLISSWSCDGE